MRALGRGRTERPGARRSSSLGGKTSPRSLRLSRVTRVSSSSRAGRRAGARGSNRRRSTMPRGRRGSRPCASWAATAKTPRTFQVGAHPSPAGSPASVEVDPAIGSCLRAATLEIDRGCAPGLANIGEPANAPSREAAPGVMRPRAPQIDRGGGRRVRVSATYSSLRLTSKPQGQRAQVGRRRVDSPMRPERRGEAGAGHPAVARRRGLAKTGPLLDVRSLQSWCDHARSGVQRPTSVPGARRGQRASGNRLPAPEASQGPWRVAGRQHGGIRR